MKNPNSPLNKLKSYIANRWYSPDYPGGENRFQLRSFALDISTYVLLPVLAVFLSRSFSVAEGKTKVSSSKVKMTKPEGVKDGSQVIVFGSGGGVSSGVAKKAPGTLVRVRLQNTVESYSSTPVFAQIVDGSLGRSFIGGILIGDGTADTGFNRLNIAFRFARSPNDSHSAFPISARALSLNGTLGLEAQKKEGFVARSALRAGNQNGQEGAGSGGLDLKDIVIRALSSGLAQEFGSAATVEQNRLQVLTLQAGVEFFAELTDFYPAAGQ